MELSIEVYPRGGGPIEIPGGRLGLELSQSLFRREGRIRKIVVDIPEDMLR